MLRTHFWLIICSILLLIGFKGYFYKEIEYNGHISDYEKPALMDNLEKEYDVIVIGGEPEGVAAAVSAARNGAKTLLVEKREELGGLFTYGMLNFLDIPRDENRKPVSRGIYEEWHKWVGGDEAFQIKAAKAAFKKLVDHEPNITMAPQTEVIESMMEDNRVIGVKLNNKYGTHMVKGKAFIDATQDAEFAVMSKVPYFVGGEDIGLQDRRMAVTLMIHLKDVDWKKVKRTARSKKLGEAKVNRSVIWGFTELHKYYVSTDEDVRLRGLNLAKKGNDYYINALQLFGIDGLDHLSKKEAMDKGKKHTIQVLQYLQKEFPGFETAKIASFPLELYVRETRHIKAEYQLPMSDVWTNKDHWDSVGIGAYPVDVQAQTKHDYGYVLSAPKKYAIPFRSLIPLEKDGLLVVGRSSGFSSLAAGSARVVPTGMVTGEAAGVASALAIKKGVTFREMSKRKDLIESLRGLLSLQGAYVEHFQADYPYKGNWFDTSVQLLMNYGLVVAGYNNDLKVEDLATKLKFANLLRESIQRVNPERMWQLRDKVDSVYYRVYQSGSDPITRDEVAAHLTEILWGLSGPDNWGLLIEKGLITKEVSLKIPQNRKLKNKELYVILASLISHLERDTVTLKEKISEAKEFVKDIRSI